MAECYIGIVGVAAGAVSRPTISHHHHLLIYRVLPADIWLDCRVLQPRGIENEFFIDNILIKIKDYNERTNQIVPLLPLTYTAPPSPAGLLSCRRAWRAGAGPGGGGEPPSGLQTRACSSQSLCWQNALQYLATRHPLQVSVAGRPQFQQA